MSDQHPYILAIADDREGVEIDLGEWRWHEKYADWMRRPGWWFLIRRSDRRVILILQVHKGEQPYYVAKHVGVAGSGGNSEIVVHGIGKKRADGHVDRLWIMPDGSVCAGDDVYELGVRMVKLSGPT